MTLLRGLSFPVFVVLLCVPNIRCAKEYLWNKRSESFQSRQATGHSAFNKWEQVYDNQLMGQQVAEGETFSVCNFDNLNGGVSGRTAEAVQNYLVSPQIAVPEQASFVQLNYSMDITKPKSMSSSLKVLKYETSRYIESDIDLIKFESFEFVNGEYFDMLDGNAVLTVPVRQKYVFIALHDTGYCGSISIHSIHTNVCPEQQFGSILMPKTYSQLSKTRISLDSRTISCAPNAKVSNLDEQIVKFCRFDGVWEKRTPAERDEEFCICRPGYYGVFEKDGKIICSRCAAGEIKNEAGNSYCRTCPVNSRANRDQTFCECNDKYYKADKTSPYMSCFAPPILPVKVKARVTFTNVEISWIEPTTVQPQWYTIKCLSCRGQGTSQVFEALSAVQGNPIVIKDLEPETDYTLVLEVHSAVVEPNDLIVPTHEIKFTTSYKLVVEEPSVSVSNKRLIVTWKPPKYLDPQTAASLKYKVDVMVNHDPAFKSPHLDQTSFSYPLPSMTTTQDVPLSIQIAVVINGSEFMGDEMFASTLGQGHVNLLDPGMSRYVMAVGIMLSMLLLVGILVCGVICMVHRTRSMAKFEQHLWNVQGHTPNGYYHHASSSDHHLGGYDYSTPAVMSSYNLNNLSSVHAFVEPSLYDDIYSVAADFCPTLPSNSVQIGKRISDSSFEGQIFGVMHCQNPTLCAVKLVSSDAAAVLAPNSLEDKKAKRRFLIEAVTMSQFHHCNVQKLHGLIYSAESPYMEMAIELCTSGSLKHYLNEAQLWTLNQHSAVFFLLRGIVHGMEYLHDLGYLHKVLRAQNVMITHNNVAKIAGFEERAFLEENDTATALDELDLVGWQPSEVIKLNKFSPAADVYSFAVLFWEVVQDCRTRPHNLDSSKEIALKTCEGKRPVLPSELPPWVESLISCCWSEDMLSRPSFSAIRQQIDSLIMNNSSILGGRPQRGSSGMIGSQEDILGQQSFYVNPNRINSLQINQFCDFDVTKWLQSLKLEKLAPAFEKRGITTFEQVVMLKETDLASMNDLNSKQRKKLINSINQFNTKTPISPPVNSSLILNDKLDSFTEQGV